MLGFCGCWAAAGTHIEVAAARAASVPSKRLLVFRMGCIPYRPGKLI
jgi:hypothetical protein